MITHPHHITQRERDHMLSIFKRTNDTCFYSHLQNVTLRVLVFTGSF